MLSGNEGLAPWPVRRCLYRLGHALFFLAGSLIWRLKIAGVGNIPAAGGVLIASNHISFFDPPMVGSSIPRPVHFVAKDQLFHMPVLGWFIRQVNAIPVRRESRDVAAFKTAQRLLESGEAVVLFPEGTRSRTGRIGPAKPGIGMLAARTGVPVIPTYVHNTHLMKRLKRIEVHFGRPMRYKGGDDYRRFSDAVLDEVRRIQEEVERVS